MRSFCVDRKTMAFAYGKEKSAVMMTDGAVMMKVQMPAPEFTAMSTGMKAGRKTCTIQNIYPDAWNTMILVCTRN